jgi:hypothetical protein
MAPPSISQQTNSQRFFSKLSAARAGLRAYDNWAVFVLLWAVVFGGIVRLLPVWGGSACLPDPFQSTRHPIAISFLEYYFQ